MAGAAISSVNGDVQISATSICEITSWTFTPTSNNPSYASNKTAGYKERVAGTKDGSGSMEGKWDTGNPATAVIEVGTEATLQLDINATQFYSVPAIIDSFSLTVNIDDGDIVGWTADFSINGAWTNPVDTSPLTLPEGFTIDEDGNAFDGEGNTVDLDKLNLFSVPPQQKGAPDVPALTPQAINTLVDAKLKKTVGDLAESLWERIEKRLNVLASSGSTQNVYESSQSEDPVE